jgi:hypothetical protein
MGIDQRVRFASVVPTWEAVHELLTRSGFPVHVGMIDGELAFPDEAPPPAWRELRVQTPQGMVTARRDGPEVVLVVWGNADAPLRQAWNALTWAFASAGEGTVQTPRGGQTAAEFHAAADLPPALRPLKG